MKKREAPMHKNFKSSNLEMDSLAKKSDCIWCLLCSSGGTRLVSSAPCECTALTLASAEENMITKLYHAPTVLVPFSFFLQRVVERKHYHPGDNGDVKHALVPEGHNEDNLGLQVNLTSKWRIFLPCIWKWAWQLETHILTKSFKIKKWVIFLKL